MQSTKAADATGGASTAGKVRGANNVTNVDKADTADDADDANEDDEDDQTPHRCPCLTCMGHTSYCSEDCMRLDFPDHSRQCRGVLRSMTRLANPPYHARRVKQIAGNGSVRNLVCHVVRETDQEVLKTSLFFVRVPFDVAAHVELSHPVKRVARTEAAGTMLRSSALFQATYRKYVEHQLRTRADGVPFLYFFIYSPDMALCFMLALPFGSQKQPDIEQIVCPCSLHSPK